MSEKTGITAWIEHLNNPLVLVGFVVFVLASVIAWFIRKAKPSQSQNAKGDGNVQFMAGRNLKMRDQTAKKK